MQKIDVMQYIPSSRERLDQLGSAYTGADNFELEEETIEGIKCAWVKVPNAASDHIILHLHGGAYFQGSIKSHATFVSQINSRANINALLPEYSLAPEAPFPQGLHDVVRLYKYLLTKFKHIILTGDSSGGGLALALMENLKKMQLPLPKLNIAIYPWVDLRDEATIKGFEHIKDDSPNGAPLLRDLVNLYCRGADKKNSLISPVFSDFTGYPPMLIQGGTKDFLYLQSKELAQKAKKAGLNVKFEVYQDMEHGWHVLLPDAPETTQAYDNIASFIKKYMVTNRLPQKTVIQKNTKV